MLKNLVKATILSIMIFFSISFLTVLFQINSPFNRMDKYYELKIGFPFEYYYEFFVEYPIPNSGWNANNLILDCVLTWVITFVLIILIKKRKHI